jgi:putative ABC transport system permease protein
MIGSSRLSLTQMLPYSLDPQIKSIPGVKQLVVRGVVRRHLPGSERTSSPTSPWVPGTSTCIRSSPARRPAQGLGKRPPRARSWAKQLAKKFGWKFGDTIPLAGHDLPDQGQQRLVLQARWHLHRRQRKAERPGTDPPVPLELLRRGQRLRQGPRGLVHRAARPGVLRRPRGQGDRCVVAELDHETKTQTEEAFNQSFAKQIGDIGLIVTAIMGAVFFTLLLLTGNTMAQAVRERIPELAVLKTIGFSNRSVLLLVLGEAVVLVAIGAVIGLALAPIAMQAAVKMSGGFIQLPTNLPPETWVTGLVLMLVFGVLAGVLPALRAMRLNIVDALPGR